MTEAIRPVRKSTSCPLPCSSTAKSEAMRISSYRPEAAASAQRRAGPASLALHRIRLTEKGLDLANYVMSDFLLD